MDPIFLSKGMRGERRKEEKCGLSSLVVGKCKMQQRKQDTKSFVISGMTTLFSAGADDMMEGCKTNIK